MGRRRHFLGLPWLSFEPIPLLMCNTVARFSSNHSGYFLPAQVSAEVSSRPFVGRHRLPFYAIFVVLIGGFLAANHTLPVGGENFYRRHTRKRAYCPCNAYAALCTIASLVTIEAYYPGGVYKGVFLTASLTSSGVISTVVLISIAPLAATNRATAVILSLSGRSAIT